MVFFTNGGAEATENAIRMARLHTGRHKVFAAHRSYHGATHGSITMTGDPRRWPSEPSIPGVVRFEANRVLTGQGHERFDSAAEAVGDRPAAVLARRLFESGRVQHVHVYSNMVTVNLLKGYTSDGLFDQVRELYQYWKPGMEMPVFEDVAPEAEAGAAPAAAEGVSGPEAAYLALVPAVLVERSRAALAKWKATH